MIKASADALEDEITMRHHRRSVSQVRSEGESLGVLLSVRRQNFSGHLFALKGIFCPAPFLTDFIRFSETPRSYDRTAAHLARSEESQALPCGAFD